MTSTTAQVVTATATTTQNQAPTTSSSAPYGLVISTSSLLSSTSTTSVSTSTSSLTSASSSSSSVPYGIVLSITTASMSTSSLSSSSSATPYGVVVSVTTASTSTVSSSSANPTSASSATVPAPTSESAVTPGPYTYLGCYVDNGTRPLTALYNPSNTLTLENCAAYCNGGANGATYTYFGVEYGSQCFCGNTIMAGTVIANGQNCPNSGTPSNNGVCKCNMPCAGNSTERCGGSGTMEIYQRVGGTSSPSSVVTSTSSSSLSSVISSISSSSTVISMSAPSSTPSSAPYGIVLSTSSSSAPATSTTGVSTSSTPIPSPQAVVMPGNYAYLNCYYDQQGATGSGNRPLQYPYGFNNTLETCASSCLAQGYIYFGVEYGVQCYCGNTIQTPDTNVPVNNTQTCPNGQCVCNFACPNNATETCGGSGTMNIYKRVAAGLSSSSSSTSTSTSNAVSITSSSTLSTGTSIAATTTQRPTSTTASPTSKPTVSGFVYQACYYDQNGATGSGNRTLTMLYTPANNTLENCAAQCISTGNTYFGVEYGMQCFCGDQVNAGSYPVSGQTCPDVGSPSNGGTCTCNMPCSGDSTELCGGSGTMNVYQRPANAVGSLVSTTPVYFTTTTTTSKSATSSFINMPNSSKPPRRVVRHRAQARHLTTAPLPQPLRQLPRPHPRRVLTRHSFRPFPQSRPR